MEIGEKKIFDKDAAYERWDQKNQRRGNDKYFYEYKVNGKDLKKNGVSLYARYFADTEKEAIKGFNALLNKRINSLTEEIDKL